MKQLTMDDFWANYEKTGTENLYFMLFKYWPPGGPLNNKGLLMLDQIIMDQTFKINDAQAKYHFPDPGMPGVLTGVIYGWYYDNKWSDNKNEIPQISLKHVYHFLHDYGKMTLLQRATEIRDIYRRYVTDPHKFIESQRKLDTLLDSAEKLIMQEERLAAQERQLAEQAALIAKLQDMIKKQTKLVVYP